MSQDQLQAAREGFRAWTDELRVLARRLPELPSGDRMVAVADLIAFLHEEVQPHMRVDEEALSPTGTGRIGSPLATTSLAYDHLAIRAWIAKLAEAEDDDIATLQELLYGLDALIRVHLWKEDELLVHPPGSSGSPESAA